MAVLAVIGGVDSRPRLGGLVQHKEWGLGTVCRIAPNGKVTVQCEGQQKAKICSISQIKLVRNPCGLAISHYFAFILQCVYSLGTSRSIFSRQPSNVRCVAGNLGLPCKIGRNWQENRRHRSGELPATSSARGGVGGIS